MLSICVFVSAGLADAAASVVLYREFGAPRRITGPGPWAQAILWLGAGALALVVARLRR